MTEEKKESYKVLTISTEGSTMTVFQKFTSPWAALDAELDHFLGRRSIPAQINITKE